MFIEMSSVSLNVFSLSVENEYLWTSGMVSDCKEEFSWCSINKKDSYPVDTSLKDTKCLAMELTNMRMKSFNCSAKMYFACEVIKMIKIY